MTLQVYEHHTKFVKARIRDMRSIIRKHHPAGIQNWLINSTVGEASDSPSLFNI